MVSITYVLSSIRAEKRPSCEYECMDLKWRLSKHSILSSENIYEENFKVDLMAPPGKSFVDTEDDSGPDIVSTVSSEALKKGTVEITNISEAEQNIKE